MINNISTYLWPGQTCVGYGSAALTGAEAKSRQAKNVFIMSDPGVSSAWLLEPVLTSLKEAGLSYDVYDRVPPNPDLVPVDEARPAPQPRDLPPMIAILTTTGTGA